MSVSQIKYFLGINVVFFTRKHVDYYESASNRNNLEPPKTKILATLLIEVILDYFMVCEQYCMQCCCLQYHNLVFAHLL